MSQGGEGMDGASQKDRQSDDRRGTLQVKRPAHSLAVRFGRDEIASNTLIVRKTSYAYSISPSEMVVTSSRLLNLALK
eukprot:scaffold604148_cov15-Prasinocladus_malaysianus.AAC.1